jgi:hypothetical protein
MQFLLTFLKDGEDESFIKGKCIKLTRHIKHFELIYFLLYPRISDSICIRNITKIVYLPNLLMMISKLLMQVFHPLRVNFFTCTSIILISSPLN